MINVEMMHDSKNIKYSIVIENGEYPEDINLPGTIVSKHVLGEEELLFKNICKMKPTPQYYSCMPMYQILSYSSDKTIAERREGYEKFKETIKSCLSEE